MKLQRHLVCPHCWHGFDPEDAVWISEHPDLIGDPKLGSDHPQRFLPSRFSVEGDALDPAGFRTTRLACPSCHLEMPRAVFQIPAVFYSILGAPACGKSYFLASMTWQLRQMLPRHFFVTMNDTDAQANARLHQYEEQQFLSADPDALVALAKTETQGDLYDRVRMGDYSVTLPRPFMFTLQPNSKHLNYSKQAAVARIACLYDNAGESFLPGADSVSNPVTRHLAKSSCLFFCFDPTQDSRFRRACVDKSNDPQMHQRNPRIGFESAVRQDTILLEAIQRIRRHAGLRDDQQHRRPLIFVVTKWDCWKDLLPNIGQEGPYFRRSNHEAWTLDLDKIEHTSAAVEALLETLCPEVVSAAQDFASSLTFIPVSATGRSPELDPKTGTLGIRPRDMAPYWVEIPLLYAMSQWGRGLVGGQRRIRKQGGLG